MACGSAQLHGSAAGSSWASGLGDGSNLDLSSVERVEAWAFWAWAHSWTWAFKTDFRAVCFHFGSDRTGLRVGFGLHVELGLRLERTSCLVLYKTTSCSFLRVASHVGGMASFRCETTLLLMDLEGTSSRR